MIVFSNQILLAFSLYDLRCIILTSRKQIMAFKKGTFVLPAPPTEKQEGRLLPPAPSPACLNVKLPFCNLLSCFVWSVNARLRSGFILRQICGEHETLKKLASCNLASFCKVYQHFGLRLSDSNGELFL